MYDDYGYFMIINHELINIEVIFDKLSILFDSSSSFY